MTTVLFRVRRLDQLRVDPEPYPPDGECRQSTKSGGREGDAVVGANGPGQSALVEESMKHRLCEIEGCGAKALTREQVTAVAIHDRQRVAVSAIARLELTLEISRPEVVGASNHARRPTRVARILPPPVADDQPVSLQDVAAGAPAWEAGHPSLPEHGQQLLGTPVRVRTPQSQQLLDHRKRGRTRRVVRPPGPVFQTPHAGQLVAVDPFVAGPSAHAIARAQLAEWQFGM